jgi:type III secretion protein N (ATPase)
VALSLGRYLGALDAASPLRGRGRVTELVGLVVRASLPGARMGELVHILSHHATPVLAEVVGFRGDEVLLLPLGPLAGVGPDSEVEATGRPFEVRCGDALVGRVLSGLGEPIDGGPALAGIGLTPWPVEREAPRPLARRRVSRPLSLGVRAIDGLCTVGEGQRIGLFAGSGVGKSTLLGQIAQGAAADVNVVCLVGERGREVREFIEESLGEEGLRRSVVVVATADAASLVRLKCAFVATAIAEYFRDQGRRVLFLLDSVTRFARAQREVGLAAGEPPARQGYPPSVFALLPRLLERTGNSDQGSITAIYTVLVAGGDMEEPIADEVRGILDGHVVLSRALAERGHWPAIDVLQSLSRVMAAITEEAHRRDAARLRELLSTYERQRDLILLGAYRAGSDRATDEAIAHIDAITRFLRQGLGERPGIDEARRALAAVCGG